MNTKEVDILIIGAGAAGLYAAYELTKMYTDYHSGICSKNIVVVEASSEIGGRAREKSWNGSKINIGAEHIRVGDKHLRRLIKELNIDEKYKIEKRITVKTDGDEHKAKEDIENMMRQPITEEDRAMNMKDWILNKNLVANYKDFVNSYGYTDFEKSDVVDTLENYGFLDFYGEKSFMKVSWSHLWEKVSSKLNIELNSTVTSILQIGYRYYCTINQNKTYSARTVYLAIPLSRAKTIINCIPKAIHLFEEIGYYKFVKIFVKTRENITNHTITHTSGSVQRLIKYSDRLYCIYADSEKAEYLLNGMDDLSWLENELKKSFNDDGIILEDVYPVYWNCGTHYYKPLKEWKFNSREEFIKKIQTPDDNFHVIGEMVSRQQGWVEGAIESFHQIHGYKSYFYSYWRIDTDRIEIEKEFVQEIIRKSDKKKLLLVKNSRIIPKEEIELFKKLKNPNIASIIEHFDYNDSTIFICEIQEKPQRVYKNTLERNKDIFLMIFITILEIIRNRINYTYGSFQQIYFSDSNPYILPLFSEENFENFKDIPFILDDKQEIYRELQSVKKEMEQFEFFSSLIQFSWFKENIKENLQNIYYINISKPAEIIIEDKVEKNISIVMSYSNFPFNIELEIIKHGYGVKKYGKTYEIWKQGSAFTSLVEFLGNKTLRYYNYFGEFIEDYERVFQIIKKVIKE